MFTRKKFNYLLRIMQKLANEGWRLGSAIRLLILNYLALLSFVLLLLQ